MTPLNSQPSQEYPIRALVRSQDYSGDFDGKEIWVRKGKHPRSAGRPETYDGFDYDDLFYSQKDEKINYDYTWRPDELEILSPDAQVAEERAKAGPPAAHGEAVPEASEGVPSLPSPSEASEGAPPPESPAPLDEFRLAVADYMAGHFTFDSLMSLANAVPPAHSQYVAAVLQRFKMSKSAAPSVPMGGGELVEALRKYGGHIRGPEICDALKHSEYPCTCGFDAILAKLEGR